MITRKEQLGMFAAGLVTFMLLGGAAVGTGYVALLAWNLEAWWQFGLCGVLTILLGIGPVWLLVAGVGMVFAPSEYARSPRLKSDSVRRISENTDDSLNDPVPSSNKITRREQPVAGALATRRVNDVERSDLPELIGAREVFLKTHRDIRALLWVFGGVCLLLSIASLTSNPCAGVTALIIFGGVFGATLWVAKEYALKRPMRMFCPDCGKFLPSDLSWVCAKCLTRHNKDNKYSVLNRCKECGTVPSAYQCHHDDCETIIYLDKDYDADACAYGVGKEGPRMNRRRQREEELAEKRHASDMLSVELDGTKKSMELYELQQRWQRAKLPSAKSIERSPRQLMEDAWAKRYQSLHQLRSYVAQLRDVARATHGKNEENLEEALSDIEDFYQEQLGKYQH